MQNLNKFLSQSKTRLQIILDQLNWTADSVMLDNHVNSKEQQDKIEEPLFPPSCATKNSVVLDDGDIRKLLNKSTQAPKKFSDLQLNFNREEKLIIYEHVKQQIDEKVPCLNEDADLVSNADIVALKKREKKNRRKHRVSKPTHTEEWRSLVELQMQSLEQHLRTKYSFKPLKENKCTDNENREKQSSKNTQDIEEITANEGSLISSKIEERQSPIAEARYKRASDSHYHSARKERRRSRSKEHHRNYKKDRHRSRSQHRRRSRSRDSRRSCSKNFHRNRSKDRPKDRDDKERHRAQHSRHNKSPDDSRRYDNKSDNSCPRRSHLENSRESRKKRSASISKRRRKRSRSHSRVK